MTFRSTTHRRKTRRSAILSTIPDFSATLVKADDTCVASPQWFGVGSPIHAASVFDVFGVGLDGAKTIIVGRPPTALLERAWYAVGHELTRSLAADVRQHPEGEAFLQETLFDPDRLVAEG